MPLAVCLLLAGWKVLRTAKGEKSGQPELFGTSVIVLSLFIQSVFYAKVSPIFSSVDTTALLADLVLAIGFVAIAMNANRIWPLVAAGGQLLAVFSHFSRAVQLDIDEMAYSILQIAPTHILTISVIIGFIGHFQRIKHNGYDKDWMDWSQSFGLGPTRG